MLLLTTEPVAAVDGTFSGSTNTDLFCSSPLISGGFPEPTSITISLSTGTTTGIVNSVSMTSAHFTFSSGAAGSYSDSTNPDGSINVSGTINGDMNVSYGEPLIDGSYPGGATFTFAGLFSGGNFTLSSATLVYTSTSLCSFGDILFSLPALLSGTGGGGSSGGSSLLVDPQITPGSIITTPQTLKSSVNAITSDLRQRVNDVFRVIKLSRQRGVEGYPPGRMPPQQLPPDQRKEKGDEDEAEADNTQSALPISRTQNGFMLNSLTGMNAGDNPYLLGTWASYSYVDFENDFAATSFDGRRHGGLVGLDASPRESVLLGVAVGYEDSDIDTVFNRGNQQTDGFTVAPYVGALLTDTWSLNASVGYSNLETDQYRTLPATTTRVTSSSDHDRWFAMANVNALTTYGNWVLDGQVGILWARDSQDSFVESDGTLVAELDSRLTQFTAGGEVAYSGGVYEPFVRFTYEYDITQTEIGLITGPQPSFDDDDVLLAGGVRFFGQKGWSGNAEFNARLGREDYDEFGLIGTIRYEW